MKKIIAAACWILLVTPTIARAIIPAPEIDPGAAPAALVALGGVLLILRGRKR
jgi:hypothetical protein